MLRTHRRIVRKDETRNQHEEWNTDVARQVSHCGLEDTWTRQLCETTTPRVYYTEQLIYNVQTKLPGLTIFFPLVRLNQEIQYLRRCCSHGARRALRRDHVLLQTPTTRVFPCGAGKL